MRLIDHYFQPAAHRTLYHYSSISGLMGIVDHRAVWAGHAYYLNDTREIIHAVDVLTTLLRKFRNLLGLEEPFSEQLIAWLKTFRETPYHIFIFSLSEEESLLSQWRSYTPHGKGVSIGFRKETIDHILQTPGFRLAQCLYTEEEHKQLLGSLMEKLNETFRQQSHPALSARHSVLKLDPFFESYRGEFLQVMAIVKHEAFREEREWRILSPYYASYVGEQVQFRAGASMIMPYTVLDLPREGLLFDEVILGPSRDVNLSHHALSTYLSNKKVCNATISSLIPYRQWEK